MKLKRIYLALAILIITAFQANALHIKGGWIEYSYLSSDTAAKTTTYNITVYLLVTCDPTVKYPASSLQQVYVGAFDAVTNAYVSTKTIYNTGEKTVSKTKYSPCLSNPPSVCFRIFNYISTITLPNNAHGYILAIQDSRRSSGIINVVNSFNTGITVTNGIPGTIMASSGFMESIFARSFTVAFLEVVQLINCKSVMQTRMNDKIWIALFFNGYWFIEQQ